MNKDMKQFNLRHMKTESPNDNLKLSKNLRLKMINKHMPNNILLLGSTGSGKSRYGIMQNILNTDASNIAFVNPSLFEEIKEKLPADSKIYHFDTSRFQSEEVNSAYNIHYNPLDFCVDENGTIDTNMINEIAKMAVSASNEQEAFWKNVAECLFKTTVYYVLENKNLSKEQKNLVKVYYALCDYKNTLSEISSWKSNKDSLAYSSYEFLLSSLPEKVLAAASLSLTTGQLNVFSNENSKYYDWSVISDTNIDIKTLAKEKAYFFIDVSAIFDNFTFLNDVLLYQILTQLSNNDIENDLPINIYIDEFQEFVPNFDIMAKYFLQRPANISIMCSLQSMASIEYLSISTNNAKNKLLPVFGFIVYMGEGDLNTMEFIGKFLNIDTSNLTNFILELRSMPYINCLVGEYYGGKYIIDKKFGFKK